MWEWVRRLWSWLARDGRIILGAYGSSSRSVSPTHVASLIIDCGLDVVGFRAVGTGRHPLRPDGCRARPQASLAEASER